MGCKNSKVVKTTRRSKSRQESVRSSVSRESVRKSSPCPSARVVQVHPFSRPSSPVPHRLARSISNTTFVIIRRSPSGQSCASTSVEDFLVDGGRDSVDVLCSGSNEFGDSSLNLDGRITRTIIRQVEDYKRFSYVNSDDISDVVEVYNCSDDSDEDAEESETTRSSSGSDSDPMLARGNRTPEMTRKIRAFENDVSSLMVAHFIPGCSTTDANVRPKAGKGVRVPCDTGKLERSNDSTALVACQELLRPQLTVAGLKTTGDDCLNSWMRRQQRTEEVIGQKDGLEEDEVG